MLDEKGSGFKVQGSRLKDQGAWRLIFFLQVTDYRHRAFNANIAIGCCHQNLNRASNQQPMNRIEDRPILTWGFYETILLELNI